MATHYHALAGIHGCLPNYSASNLTYDEAVQNLADLQELDGLRRTRLRVDGYLELDLPTDGNEYCEVIECYDPDSYDEVDELREDWR